MARNRIDYNSIKWEDHFYIDHTSPSGLRWKRDTMGGRYYKILVKEKHSVAGSKIKHPCGLRHCWQVRLDSGTYVVHRIIWYLTYGSIAIDRVIDHLNGDPWDNSIANLELKTTKANSQNSQKRKDNTSGHTGVVYKKNITGIDYYGAIWKDCNGNSKSKYFSIRDLGAPTALKAAIDYRESKITSLNASGQLYTDRHGK